ncbi:ABC transporter ATP-binding protein [Actinopolymorpha sp. B11F2]|uniref:ABC transporter ATP-binding protein n=1 Tax=Actinopolymorpha sp. B11F2 TaxID=3160862 RepID=UPI0032E46293
MADPASRREGVGLLLEVTDLRVSFRTSDGVLHAVRGISFDVAAGQTLAIVGESGSGKSVATQALVGLTRGAEVSGRALFAGRDMATREDRLTAGDGDQGAGRDLLAMGEDELRDVRGAEIGMVFQDSQSSLHPYYRVGWQIAEMVRAHDRSVSRAAARQRAIRLLARVGIPQPERRVDDFPHQFSGGMRQRVMIAMAMALGPVLLIADEPTTALDVTVQAQVLEVIGGLRRESGMAVLLITHDLGVVAEVADEIVVMYAGAVMERAGRRELFYRFHHPYTEGLLNSLPSDQAERRRLRPIPGTPPSLIEVPGGCPFHPRCPYVFDRCRTDVPPLRPVYGDDAHRSACWLPVDEAARIAARSDLGGSGHGT